MVLHEGETSVGTDAIAGIFNTVLGVGVAIIVLLAIIAVMWWFFVYKRRFDIQVIIKSDRSGEKYKVLHDVAAILTDKKNNTKYLRLWTTKVDLPVPPFQILQATNKGDLIELWRRSEDEFVYLTPSTISKKYVIRQDGTKWKVADIEQKQVEGDIAYWNVKRKSLNKGLFDTDALWMKLLPFIPHLMGGVITIFVLYILLDNLPSILSELRELAKELRSLKGADINTFNSIWSLIKYI